MATLVIFLAHASSVGWWADQPPHKRGPAPYPYPSDRKYNPQNERTGPDQDKINVRIILR